jgi:hypothetical protein
VVPSATARHAFFKFAGPVRELRGGGAVAVPGPVAAAQTEEKQFFSGMMICHLTARKIGHESYAHESLSLMTLIIS